MSLSFQLLFVLIYILSSCRVCAENCMPKQPLPIDCFIKEQDISVFNNVSSEYTYCCSYINGNTPLSPSEILKYMNQIQQLAISQIVLRIIVGCLAFGFLFEAIRSKDITSQSVSLVCTVILLLVVFCLSFSVVGIIDQTNLIDVLDDLNTNNCYPIQTEHQYPPSWFKSKCVTILALQCTVGVLAVISACSFFCIYPNVTIETEDTVQFGSIFLFSLQCISFIIEMVSWIFIFPMHENWNNSMINNECYEISSTTSTSVPTAVTALITTSLTIMVPTLEPTLEPSIPTSEPTFQPSMEPTIASPTMQPTFSPTTSPTFVAGTQNFHCIPAENVIPFLFLGIGVFLSFLLNLYLFRISKKDNTDMIDNDGHNLFDDNGDNNTGLKEEYCIERIKDSDCWKQGMKSNSLKYLKECAKAISFGARWILTDKEGKKKRNHSRIPRPSNINLTINRGPNTADFPMDIDDMEHKEEKMQELDVPVNVKRKCACMDKLDKKLEKYETFISWAICIYQVATMIYSFLYSLNLAIENSPDLQQITWSNYQCYVKSMTVESTLKNIMSTCFVWYTKKDLGTQSYETPIIVLLFATTIVLLFYIPIFITHLLFGVIVYCWLLFGGVFIMKFVPWFVRKLFGASFQQTDENKFHDDLFLWFAALRCTVIAFVSIIIIECMIIFWDNRELYWSAVAIVLTERKIGLYFGKLSSKMHKVVNTLAMLL